MTETVHRVSVLDLSSLTAQTIPVTGDPFNINRAVSPRYWAYRQRRASVGLVILIVSMHHGRSRYAKQLRDLARI
jgi:hypothetical protein